uniref:Divalent cation tolerance protein n=1 Tax=Candidatus Kentrum sp. MB TaxID=2138164 RepID=A0A451BA96_9GAMM|nr:MAG: divalent cation tolerance protein [Candidatus Kentron sp. MB]VFK30378.1 MAG: divalent cation tolerance protein [Candidatus Kentron sp. MB]VFK75193.1 MAG: divalent cation tolerance protein [Candidatus Kentron sp. MB]
MSEIPHRIVLCTCPDLETAEQIATNLVDSGLAACVNIVPKIRSIYKWQGKIENHSESQLIIKTHQQRIPDLEQSIRQQHPYDVPEIIAIKIDSGSSEYLTWLNNLVR